MLNRIKKWWQRDKNAAIHNQHDQKEEFNQRLHSYLHLKNIQLDSQQQKVIPELQQLYKLIESKKPAYAGIYLWGGVGTGKTLLMDALYHITAAPKIRLHHHELFKNLMNNLHQYKNAPYPLEASIQNFTKQYRLACFDDLHLNDIADAKLWQGVFTQAQKANLSMLITSNTHPANLMDTPSYREKIQPLLELMQQQLHIINVDAGIDYRSMQCHKKTASHSACLPEKQFEALYYEFNHQQYSPQSTSTLQIQNRSIACIAYQEKAIFFTLQQICGSTRSYADYIELTEYFECIVITQFDASIIANPLSLQRFIWLIDIIYDKNTRFFITTDNDPIKLLQQQQHPDLNRTISRLTQLF